MYPPLPPATRSRKDPSIPKKRFQNTNLDSFAPWTSSASGAHAPRSDTHLEEKFDSLDGGHSCFWNSSGDPTSQEVLGEGDGLLGHLRVSSGAAARSRWGSPVEVKWLEPPETWGDLRRSTGRMSVNAGTARWLVACGTEWAGFGDVCEVRLEVFFDSSQNKGAAEETIFIFLRLNDGWIQLQPGREQDTAGQSFHLVLLGLFKFKVTGPKQARPKDSVG